MDKGRDKTPEERFAAGRALHRQGQLAEAERHYRAALESDASHADAMEWLGVLCLQRGQTGEAVGWLERAAALRPGNAAFLDNLAAAAMQAGRPQEAAAALRRSLAAAPEAIDTYGRLADVLRHLQRPGEAMGMLEQAVERDPHLKTVCRDTAKAATEEARCGIVLENCRHILARYPAYAPAHYSRACALLNLGKAAEACRACEQALVLDPTVPVYYHILIEAGTAAQKTAAAAALRQLEMQDAALPEDGRAMLHFLLAKLCDENRHYDEAFSHLAKANAVKRALISYDEERELGGMAAIAAAFTAESLARDGGFESSLPVFVVGMPRSGTSLVEQILASHPQIYGAGELPYLPDLAAEYGIPGTVPEQLRELGADYVRKLAALSPDAARVVDKLPLNFLHIGLIHLALPGARIIHVSRDALDTCLSCYSLMFSGDVGFAYDLGELGRYYRAYADLMDHWRSALPPGAMLEVRYEDVVRDLPGEARRMVHHCGLAWDEHCIAFHRTHRAVATASLHQVRQPLHRRAIGRAQAYVAHLEPLRQALGPVMRVNAQSASR